MNETVNQVLEQIEELLELGYTRAEALKVINLSLKLTERRAVIQSNEITNQNLIECFDWDKDKTEWEEKSATQIKQELKLKQSEHSIGMELAKVCGKSYRICKDNQRTRVRLVPPYKDGVIK